MGKSTLRNFNFRGKVYNITVDEREFEVWCDGNLRFRKPLGEQIEII